MNLWEQIYPNGIDWLATGALISTIASVVSASAAVIIATIAIKTFCEWFKREDREHAIDVLSIAIKAETKFNQIRTPYWTVKEKNEAEQSLGLIDKNLNRLEAREGINDQGYDQQKRQIEARMTHRRIDLHTEYWGKISEILALSRVIFYKSVENELNKILELKDKISQSATIYPEIEDDKLIEKRRKIIFFPEEKDYRDGKKFDEIQLEIRNIQCNIEKQISSYILPSKKKPE